MKKIKLTKGYTAIIDDEDFERIGKHKWCASIGSNGGKVYAVRYLKKFERDPKHPHVKKGYMHYEVLGLKPSDLEEGQVIDHVNCNSLDCRKLIKGIIQLEVVTHLVNMERSKNWKKKKKHYEEPSL